MDYIIKTDPNLSKFSSDCLVLPCWEEGAFSSHVEELDKATGSKLTYWMNQGDFSGKLNQTLLLHQLSGVTSPRVLLVGCGKSEAFTPTQFYQVITTAAGYLASLQIQSAAFCFAGLTFKPLAWMVYHAVLAAEQALYRFDQFKSKKEPPCTLQKIIFHVESQEETAAQSLQQAQVIAAAMKQAKDLGNLPSNICTPAYLAEQAVTLSKKANVKVTVYERDELEKMNMHAFLAVAQGSAQSPRFIVIEYTGGKSTEKPIALVGKGVTFDSGGISIKPAATMDEMRYDMCGAATVFGVLSAASELKLPLNIIGVMACVENMPSSTAYKPGDIITTSSGQTIEILNTDAEGRVVLADALSYVARFKPDIVIDIATLTGAIIVALGDKASGLMTKDDALAEELLSAGECSWDRLWRLPLWDEYQEQIKSSAADMANIGIEGGKSITAACLLSRFTESYRWAHLDIAGTAWQSGKNKTSTGRPIPLLMEFLLNRSRK